jgi:hypothetical protein
MDCAITSRKKADDQKGNLDASIFTVFQRKRVHVKVLTMTHVEGDMGSTTGELTSVSEFINAVFSRDHFNFHR